MRKLKLFFACLLMAVLSIGQVWATTTYKLTQVTSVSAGNKYVFVQSSRAMNNTITSNAINSTATYSTTNLKGDGTETYVWTLESGDDGKFYLKNISLSSNSYLNNASSGNVSLGNKSTQWRITFTDKVALIDNPGNSNRFLGYNNATDYRYKAYAASNLSSYAHDISVYILEEETESFTITAQSNNTSLGTVSLSGKTITATPTTGNRVSTSNPYTVSPAASATVAQTGNSFAVTPSANTTVTINFEAIPTYTVSFSTGEGNPTQANIPETVGGQGITLPEGPTPACSANGWTFAGWKETSAVASETTTAPTLLTAGTNYKPTTNCTLYAVYKRTESGAVTDLDVTETFEDQAAESTYNTTKTYNAENSNAELAWSMYYGCISTNDKITGNNSAQMRLYYNKTSDFGYIKTTTPVSGLQSINFKARVSSTDIKMSVWYSTNGTNWTAVDENLTFSATGTGLPFSSTINGTIGTDYYIKIGVGDDASFPSSSNTKLIIDDIQFNYKAASSTTYYLSAPTCTPPTCEDLGTPAVTVTNKTYNSAKLTWAAVDNADKYLVKFNGVDQTATGNLYFDATGLDAETQYTYQVKALAEEGQDDWCDGVFSAEANFTTEPTPAATLTLSEIGETHNFAGDHTVGETVTLPLSATECSKTFVGWDADADCNHAPTYAPGASYTLTATTQTLYAVYANPVGAVTYVKTALASIPSGSEVVVTELYSEKIYAAANDGGTSAGPAAVEVTETTNVLNVGSNTNIFWTITKSGDNFSFTVKGGTDKLYCTNTNNGVRVGTNENNVFSINNNYLYNNATSRYVGYNHGDGGLFRCYTTINTNINGETLAFYKKNVNYEDYSTACAAPLASPTFSVDPADGPFDTEISVVLDAAEGTIYYTLNGTDPTNESTEYIDPIVLNTCGNKTIKAIAISSTNHSAVASATYEMNIPVPTNSQVAPYSPTEAREVIASGCYDGTTIMYVKGVVKSTTEYSSTFGNYDVVVRNIGNESSETFTYYHMYKASGNTTFTADENIEVGDTILAAGVLTLYGSTYEFANNTCYMVEHKKIASKTSIANDEANAYTVEEAKAFCNAPTVYDLSDEVYVKGVAYGAPNNQGTFNIHDANSDNTFQIYKGTLSAALEALSVEIEENDTIVAKGTIQYYNSTTYQMNAGGEVVTVKKYVAPVIAVTGVELDETSISLKEGSSRTLVATVNPTEASNKNVTWESSDPTIATVDNGAVTAVAIGTATITVTTEDGGLSATCTVKVIDPSARTTGNAVFQKVTATDQITDGKYLIVYAAAGVDTVAFDGALTTLDAVGNTIDVTIDGDYIVAPGDAAFTIDVTNHTLKSYSGKYIGRTANSNGMNQADDATLTNTFAIDGDGNAVITSSGNPTLRYNKASDQIRFRYYKTGQQNIQLYKMVEPEEIRGNLNDGKWGTICPAKKVLVPTGASFYKLNYMELNPDGSPYKFFFDEIGENAYLEAGKPYLFIAEGTTITGVKVGDAADDGLHVHNGFVGYIGTSNYDLSSDNDVYTEGANNYYGLQNNIFKLIYGTSSYMINERAFVQITPSSKPATTEQPAPKYSRRRLVVGAGAPQVTTGTENIEASETPVKVMINGQLFILRGEKMYDATGRLVK